MKIFKIVVFLLLILNLYQVNLYANYEVKYPEVREVFDEINNAIGTVNNKIPELEFESKTYKVAFLKSRGTTKILKIEIEAIEACKALGENYRGALAFILGHELAHFYLETDLSQGEFISSFLVERSLFRKNIEEEKHADIFGAFAAFLAGYNIENYIPELLDEIYRRYELDDKSMVKYPPLRERKELAFTVCNKLSVLKELHKSGIYLMALGRYSEASVCFQYIEEWIKQKEIFNNLGLSILAQTFSSRSSKKPLYHFPLELDPDLKLRSYSSNKIKEMQKEAMRFFQNALNQDARYLSAKLNLISTKLLLGELDDVFDEIQWLKKQRLSNLNLAKVLVLEGIYFGLNRNNKFAEESFRDALEKYSNDPILTIVENNSQVLKGGKFHYLSDIPSSPPKRKIDGVSFQNLSKITFDESTIDYGNSQFKFKKLLKSNVTSIETEYKNTFLQIITNSSLKNSMNLKIGNSIEVNNNNGWKVFSIKSGFIIVDKTQRLFIKVNDTGIIKEWGVYAILK